MERHRNVEVGVVLDIVETELAKARSANENYHGDEDGPVLLMIGRLQGIKQVERKLRELAN